ncbi:hypothetical protein SMD44_08538 [Streptomyces alboflavus]|uniref:Uncharacterized protein n=1 Tax=Streptomyces alboflavus TaxID=67267 RepID=A0A1Z1WRH5_9ACTN|nr:hypothetical protein SMD44_08538 [Streptomyces alboflavus]
MHTSASEPPPLIRRSMTRPRSFRVRSSVKTASSARSSSASCAAYGAPSPAYPLKPEIRR